MAKTVRRVYGIAQLTQANRNKREGEPRAEPIQISTILDMTDEEIGRDVSELRATIISTDERKRREVGGHGGLIPTSGELSARRIGEKVQRYRLDQLLLAQQIRSLNARLDAN